MNPNPVTPCPGPGTNPEKDSRRPGTCQKSDRELKESEERFRKIFENSPIGIALVAPDLRFISVNPAWIAMTGYSEEELLQLTVRDITHPDHLAGDLEHIRDLIAGVIPVYRTEKRYTRKDGSILWGLLIVTVIRDDEGVFQYLAAQIEDITERKRADDALRESNRRLTTLITSLQGMVYRCRNDPDWTMEYVSDGCVDLTGYRPEEFVSERTVALGTIIHPDDRKDVWDQVQEAIAKNRPFQMRYRIIARDGSIQWVAELGRGVFSSGGNLLAIEGYIADITEWQNAEEAVRHKTALFEANLQASRDGILVVGPDGKKLLQNKRVVELWKIPPDVANDPDDAQQIRHVMQMTRDPEYFVEKIVYLYDHLEETSHDVVELIDGTILDRYSSPVRGADGKYYGRIWQFHDITEQQKAEAVRESLIAELARKNTELDLFTYTVSHDLRSPLIAIRSLLALLEDDIRSGDTSRAESDIRQISKSAVKLESLINSLLTLSRSGRIVSTPLPVPLHECVLSAAGLLDSLIRERGVELVVERDLPVIMGDQERLVQVMTNLFDNAIKFMGDLQHPRIEVGMQQDDGGTIFFVRDNGSGIRNEDLSRVFGLYERLSPDIPGTGIGLATVKRIIEAHGGRIWAESEGLGKGTTFRFTLPVFSIDGDEET